MRLWGIRLIGGRTAYEEIMSDTDKARRALEQQQRAGTHNPATACPSCGAIRTPGISHSPPVGDGTQVSSAFAGLCTG